MQGRYHTPNGLRHPWRVCIPLPESVYDIGAESVLYSNRFTTSLHGRNPTHGIGLRHHFRVGIPLTASVYDHRAWSVSNSQHRFTTSLKGRYSTPRIGLRHSCRVGTPHQTVYGILAESVSHSNRFTTSLHSRYPTPAGLRHPYRVGIPLPVSICNILP